MKTRKIIALCLTGALAVSAMTGCGINKNATAASLADGTTVSMGVANFCMRYQQAATDALYRSILGEDVWAQDLYGNGSTMEDSVKADVMENLHDMYTLKAHMAEYNVALTSEDTQAIKTAASAFISANSSAVLKEIGADQEVVEELLTLHTIQAKVRDAIMDTADSNVSDEEANMRKYTMLSFSTSGSYDEANNYVELTEEEIAAVGEEAQAVYAEITEPSDIEAVAEAHDMNATSATYAADNTSLSEEIKSALDALHEGEMSELISTESGYYILRLDAETDEEATETNRQTIISKRQNEVYEEVMTAWQENDGWKINEKEVAKVLFKNTFTQPEKESADSADTEAVAE